MTVVRSPTDFNIDLIDRMIAMLSNQRSILRMTRGLVVTLLVMMILAIIAGFLSPWSVLISFAGFVYGLWASGKALRELGGMISTFEQKRAVAKFLHRFFLECRPKLLPNELSRWLDINAPGSSFAETDSFPYSYLISFPDEDTRMLFRLTHL